MIPLRLKLSGFLSYLDPVELDFTGFELACISGANGAGKSSILDAITWALFGQARRRDDALINSHTAAAEVVFDFEYEQNRYRVQRAKPRDKTSLLEFLVHDPQEGWRPLTEHSLRETEASIQQTLRMDFETFTNASFFLQGRADQFAQQRPGDRKRILSSILGLEVWESYREAASARRKRLESEMAAIESLLAEIEAELSQEDERKLRLKTLEESLAQAAALRQARETSLAGLRRQDAALLEQRRLLEVLEGQRKAAAERAQKSAARIAERQAEYERCRQQLESAPEIEAAYQRWQQARLELENWEAVAANFRQYEAQRAAPLTTIAAERSRLEQERATLAGQQEQMSALEEQLPALEASLREAQDLLAGLNARLALRPQLEAGLRSLAEDQSRLAAENKQLKAEMNEIKERIDRLKAAEGAACPLCGQPLSPPERAQLISALEEEGKEKGDRYRANLEKHQQDGRRLQSQEAELAALQQVEGEARQQQRAVDQLADRQAQAGKMLAEWQASGALRLAEVSRSLADEQFAGPARLELERLDAALKELGYDAASHDAARRAEQEGRASEEHYRLLETARAALDPLQRELGSLNDELAASQKEADELQTACDKARSQLEAEAAGLPDLALAEAELLAQQEQENRLRMQVGGARQEVDVLNTLRARKAEKLAQKEETARLAARHKTLERAFGKDGIPALLIEQALPEIEAQANQILDRLTAGGMSVRFATQKDYRDKNREDKKETLDILISDAAGVREYEMFSGGEAFRVNFAIRLALSRVLAQRAGARLQTLVIDEGFGSQDTEGRQRLIEAINLVRDDFAKILVITHLEELKDAFPARIEVEKMGRGSALRVVTWS